MATASPAQPALPSGVLAGHHKPKKTVVRTEVEKHISRYVQRHVAPPDPSSILPPKHNGHRLGRPRINLGRNHNGYYLGQHFQYCSEKYHTNCTQRYHPISDPPARFLQRHPHLQPLFIARGEAAPTPHSTPGNVASPSTSGSTTASGSNQRQQETLSWIIITMKGSNGELLDDFGDHFDELGRLLLDPEADEETGLICTCGSGLERTTKCYDCTEYAAVCKMCFVAAHFRNPFHWAEVWDNETGFFVRHDISKLDHVIQLGHNWRPCKSPTGERLFTVIDGNGIHSTRLAFCGCREMPPKKIRQLMRARLFPATTKDPHTAFTVNMLKEFQLHNLESKKAAYDYLGAIRRLSDISFTADISNPYAAFLRVVRVFNFLTLKKRSGQFHGIDTILRHRPAGNLLVCNVQYLKVVNKQDKKKFKNMAITGTVNCQCSHVFILSSVDLPHAERFANSNYALAMAVRKHKPTDDFTFKLQIEIDDVDHAATYDIAYELESIKKMRWGVPALHVQGHQDSCTYLFGTAYMECVGHFHGETAEHYWPEANQLGPHVRQMNLGHRQDTIINHHGDWNHKKTMKIASDLAEDLQTAKKKYLEKRNHYIDLSISFQDRVAEWDKMPRESYKQGKEAISTFRSDQKCFMASVGDKVASQTTLGPAIEDEKLFLPSDLTEMERQKMDLVALGAEESRWREGQAFDVLRALQHIVKSISALRNRKLKHDRQQKQNSRAGDQIADAIKHQNHHIESYNSARLALISLNGLTNFLSLTEADLFMKSVQQKRRVGDSKRTDGLLWWAKALATGESDDQGDNDITMADSEHDNDIVVMSGTQMSKRKSGGENSERYLQRYLRKGQKGGYGNWASRTLSESIPSLMTHVGDRVQWFRAEAEMQRWQEQWEQKLAELLRTRRSFSKMQLVWEELASLQPLDSPGAAACARQKAAMYARRTAEAEKKIKEVGHEELLEETANIVAIVESERNTAREFIEALA
ncbi:CxC2 domain-containing protein [Mycena venus]|uniref:CxC2 domain-containing protein n=1 Tax=Mycena venus TaxID=2733690 RepID=A0A8H7DFS3_9AGAR|nr:CxC2 domain-containing protein [Mycena venus]